MTPAPAARRSAWPAIALLAALAAQPAAAEVELVSIEAPNTQVWVGQKAPFYVKLRSLGPFTGAASFSLPQVPRAVIVGVGNPTVSTEDGGDDTWYVQTHEFALFSQASGKVVLPAFEVRFGGRDEPAGPPVDRVEKTSEVTFDVKNPPGRQGDAYLVTTSEIDVTERWDPQPADAKQGDVFRRTISQSAEQVTGMALAPPPRGAPPGVKVYLADPQVSDKTNRGDFIGARTDTITYMLTEPGEVTLPAIKYVWWNPAKESFGDTTLPSVTIDVAAVAVPVVDPKPKAPARVPVWLLIAIAAGVSLVVWQWPRLVAFAIECHRRLNPPDRVVARRLLRACRRNDAKAAERAWVDWQNAQPGDYRPAPNLAQAAAGLAKCLYGTASPTTWDGGALATAFRREHSTHSPSWRPHPPSLAPLNPR
ncbi:hypothetical protein KOR34_07610 [Posidoniimonas corsicana]|uniref:DUF7939 domain-containing protein n=1 Tax=Posidoniimonas corsicana TaxID=1938618 RepID=A0A5C5VDX1_9BACT|nr:BatD family protein [Posidoniimonas corsicana]TWT35865.1 hypothetical protein KOR34_07610 [Posidoniimonas corsicana]